MRAQIVNASAMITVVIPVYGAGPNLQRVVEALQCQQPPVGPIIISHSGGGNPSGLFEGQENVTVLHSPERLYAAGARNRGFALAKTEWVAFIDEDVIVEKDWHSSICDAIGSHEAACILGSIGFADTGGYWGLSLWLIEFSDIQPHRPARYVRDGAGASANLTVKRDVFERSGGFPEFSVGEDTIALAKIRDLGEQVWFEPSAIGRHVNLPGFKRNLRHNFNLGVSSATIRAERSEFAGSIATRIPILSFGVWIARLVLVYRRQLVPGAPVGLALKLLPGVFLLLLAHNVGFSKEAFAAKRRGQAE